MSDEHTTERPTDYDQLFPGRFLKAGLFQGKPVTMTITGVELEALPQERGPDKPRGVISFRETPMQLVLNSTNGQCLAAMFGRKVQEWVGRKVTLSPEEDAFGKDRVPCIRVKGSPEIEQQIEVEIKLPRKKPRKRTLVPTGKKQAREPGSEG